MILETVVSILPEGSPVSLTFRGCTSRFHTVHESAARSTAGHVSLRNSTSMAAVGLVRCPFGNVWWI